MNWFVLKQNKAKASSDSDVWGLDQELFTDLGGSLLIEQAQFLTVLLTVPMISLDSHDGQLISMFWGFQR